MSSVLRVVSKDIHLQCFLKPGSGLFKELNAF